MYRYRDVISKRIVIQKIHGEEEDDVRQPSNERDGPRLEKEGWMGS